MSEQMNEKSMAFWQAYLATTPDAEARAQRFCGVYQTGDTAEDADYGAQLIMAGLKTTTSALLWEYEMTGEERPFVGALGVQENGRSEPVCIVETTWLGVIPLNQVVDVDFIVGYGEWGVTPESWQDRAWAYYAPHCRELGREPQLDMRCCANAFGWSIRKRWYAVAIG